MTMGLSRFVEAAAAAAAGADATTLSPDVKSWLAWLQRLWAIGAARRQACGIICGVGRGDDGGDDACGGGGLPPWRQPTWPPGSRTEHAPPPWLTPGLEALLLHAQTAGAACRGSGSMLERLVSAGWGSMQPALLHAIITLLLLLLYEQVCCVE